MKTIDAIKELNGMDIISERFKIEDMKAFIKNNKKQVDVDEHFMTMLESVKAVDEGKIPEKIAELYNSLVDALEASNKEEVKEEPTPSKPAKAEPKAKAAKAEPKAKEKVIEKAKAEPKAKAAKVETKVKSKVEPKAKTVNNKGIGKFIIDKLLAGKTKDEKILEEVIAKFNSKTTLNCIRWYKNKINKK